MKKGFTLIELLVAMAVTALLVVLLLSISSNILQNFERVRGSTEFRREANAALDAIIADLETLSLPARPDGEVLRVTMESVNGVNMPWLTLIASARDGDIAGMPASAARAVSHRLAYLNPVDSSATKPRYNLYRVALDGGTTFTNAIGSTNLVADVWNTSQPTTRPDDLLAADVVDFHIRFQKASDGAWVDPASVGQPLTLARSGARIGTTTIPGGFSAAEVSFTVLSQKGAKLLRDGAITRNVAIARFGRSYSRRTSLFPSLKP
jgi:prepilin-type N-terminal cleavage/methylation domain-containing protein